MKNSSKNLVVVGVNYHKTSIDTRSRFALGQEKLLKIFQSPDDCYSGRYFVLSTCNRTEIYSINQQPEELIRLLASFTGLTQAEVRDNTFVRTGDDAVNHLFKVASGLDSQIIGDYEIVGQLKNAFSLAKANNRTNGFMEKLVNTSLQSSKEVKKRTKISDGTASVSYAAIKQLKNIIGDRDSVNICLIGLGKIGTLTLKNLKEHLPSHNITVINRNTDHAAMVAEKYKVGYSPFMCQRHAMKTSDVLIVATAADEPFISKADIIDTDIKVVFDLSVPCNVENNVTEIADVKLYNVDKLSDVVNQTIEQRRTEIPAAESIISEYIKEFQDWEQRRKYYRAKECNDDTGHKECLPAS